jgi:hypothetical protein
MMTARNIHAHHLRGKYGSTTHGLQDRSRCDSRVAIQVDCQISLSGALPGTLWLRGLSLMP